MTADEFKTAAQRKFGDLADQYLQLYPVTADADAQRAAHEACADEINWNMRQWAAAQAKLGKKAYTYFFTRIPHAERSAVAAGGDAHGGNLLRVQQPQRPGDADLERRRHQARRPDVVVLGELHHQG